MSHGRQLRLFLVDGNSSGPRFYEIVNRTIQALAIPPIRIKDLVSEDWPEFQKPGVYLVHGVNDTGADVLYVGRAENVGKRVQGHPDKLEFEVTSLLLFSSKDENLNASQVGWLESKLIDAASEAKRTKLHNVQKPERPILPKAELATVSEFFEDLVLIAQTAGYEFFSAPKAQLNSIPASSTVAHPSQSEKSFVKFFLDQPTKNIHARGYPSEDGFVVLAGSDASPTMTGSYLALRQKLVEQGVLIPKPGDPLLMHFTVDYSFTAPSAAGAVIVGSQCAGTKNWKTADGITLGEYLNSMSSEAS